MKKSTYTNHPVRHAQVMDQEVEKLLIERGRKAAVFLYIILQNSNLYRSDKVVGIGGLFHWITGSIGTLPKWSNLPSNGRTCHFGLQRSVIQVIQ